MTLISIFTNLHCHSLVTMWIYTQEALLKLLSPMEMRHCRELYDYSYTYGMPQPDEMRDSRMLWYLKLAAMRGLCERKPRPEVDRAEDPCSLVWWHFLEQEVLNLLISRSSHYAPEVIVILDDRKKVANKAIAGGKAKPTF